MKNKKKEIKPKFAIYSMQIMNEEGKKEEERCLVAGYLEGMILPNFENFMTQFAEKQGVRLFSSGRVENANINDIVEAMVCDMNSF